MLLSFIAFLLSLVVALLIVRSKSGRLGRSSDSHSGPQKIHARITPRIGGLAIAAGLAAAVVAAAVVGHRHLRELLLLLVASVPVFAAGLAEDLTKRVPPKVRLLAAAVSAGLAIWLLQALVPRVDVYWIDRALQVPPIAWAFTIFAAAGLANAVNIIDGLNGLAGMVCAMMFASLAYVALQAGDTLVLAVALVMVGAIGGFFVWNYPTGLVFLGDGGAYMLGFIVATMAILLVARNPQVSAWYPVLLFIYPIFETLFSAYRRVVNRRRSVAAPDASHLHSLVYKRLMRLCSGSSEADVVRRNSLTSPYLWVLCGLAVGPATLLFRETAALVGLVVVFCGTYVWIYVRIVRFRTPRWLIAPDR